MTIPEPSPSLSLVVTGRNDDYGQGFLGRFLRVLEFNAGHLFARGVAHELVLIEWAPPPGRPLLVEVLRAELPARVAATIRAVVVAPEYQDAMCLNPNVRFLEFTAKNVGIRRARGRLVLTTNADVFLGRHVLDTIAAGGIRDGVIYRAMRVDLPSLIDHSAFDWDVLEDARNHAGRHKPLQPPLFSWGAGDFMLVDKETLVRLRGYNEVYRVARVGVDRNFLVKAHASGVPIVDIGGPVYHINHASSFRASRNAFRGREHLAPYGDERWPSNVIVEDNPPTWGLAEAPERPAAAGIVHLDFDWRAVPPLVALKRLRAASQ